MNQTLFLSRTRMIQKPDASSLANDERTPHHLHPKNQKF